MRNSLLCILFWIAGIVQASMGQSGQPTSAKSAMATTSVMATTAATGREPIVGLPCDGCEAVFQGMPARPASETRLAPASEPGEALLLSGTVTDATGRPQPGVVIYAYQTNRRGLYPANNLSGAAKRHGRLRGWARTDAAGRYAFRTIRPGNYPIIMEPQHIHMMVVEPGRCAYFLGDVLFADDRHLDQERRLKQQDARGGNGIVQPRGSAARGWTATRNIQLGLNIVGYKACRH